MENNEFYSLMSRIESLEKKVVDALGKLLDSPKEPYQSDKTNELYAALAEAQSKLPPISNNKKNPWFDAPYVDIFEIARTIYPVLGEYGLSLMQPTRITDEGGTVLYTRLCHSSGQWMESRVRVIPPKNDIDSFKSTLNTLRAAEILTVLGLGVQGDPLDDDGEVAMIETRAGFTKAPSVKNVETKKQDSEVITKEQREEIEYEMGDYIELAEEIMNRCHVRSLADIPKSQFRNAIAFVRKNKQAREGKSV